MPAQALQTAVVLAFDTSTESLSVGLQTGGSRWVQQGPGGAAASAGLLPAVHALMQQAGCAMGALHAVAFGQGPGAFTGLRTSAAVAQGLAFGLGLPVLPVDSLLLVAEQARRQVGAGDGFDVGVAMDARMGEVYAARYHWQAGAWHTVQTPGLWAPGTLAAEWAGDGPAATCGSAMRLFDALAPAASGGRFVAVGDDRADALLELALQAWAAGQGVDAAQALPLYLRDKVAQTTAERAAAKAAAGVPS